MAGEIRENGPKTGNSLVMHVGNCAILHQNFAKSPCYLFLDIQLQFYCMIKYSLKSENVINFSVYPNFKACPTESLTTFKISKCFSMYLSLV